MPFFAEGGTPCGVFSRTHLIVMAVCFLLVWTAVVLTRRMQERTLVRLTRVIAVLITVLEGGKIAYCFIHGQYGLNQWLPLWFCSLFLYCAWCAGFGKGKIRRAGRLFLVGGGIIAGASFLIMPSTSVANYPMWHYLSCYSMLFHSLMHYLGLMYLVTGVQKLTVRDFSLYALFVGVFCVLGIVVNHYSGCNLMFMREPYNLPIPFLHTLAASCQPAYSLVIYLAYVFGTFFPTLGVYRLVLAVKEKMRHMNRRGLPAGESAGEPRRRKNVV